MGHTANLARARQLEQLNTYFQEERYAEIVTLLSATLDSCSSFTPSKESAARTPDRESQIDIYVESLFHTGAWARCLKWAEAGFHCYFRRITRINDSGEPRSPTKLEWDTIASYLSIFNSCLEQLPDDDAALSELPLSNASRMAGNLVRIIAAQVMDDGLCFSSALPWILLFRLSGWQEGEAASSTVLPPSLALLNTAHELLGQKSACTLEQGRLLNYTVDKLVSLLANPKDLCCTEQLRSMLEQAVFCLYAHPNDMASICGLTASDVAGLREYMQGIMAMNCQKLAQLGITSSQLSSLAQIASLTGVSQASVQAHARKQAEFEQNYLRDLIGGNASSSGATNKTPSSSSLVSGMANKQSTASKPYQTNTKYQGPQKTVGFKAKSVQPSGATMAGKVSPAAAGLPQLKSTTVTKFPGATVTPVAVPASSTSTSSSGPSSMSSTMQKLSSSGVTLSKPSGSAMPRNLPQGVSVTSKAPSSPDLAKKFPHLNITNLAENSQAAKSGPGVGRGAGRGGGVRPMGSLQVKSPAQLLRPAAAAAAAQSQMRKPSPAGGQVRPQGNQAAKQKLAEFKEQMKKTLNMPGAQRKPAPKPMGAKPSGLINTKPGQPSSAGVRQVQGGASVRPTQPAVKSQVALGARPPSRKTPPPPKPGSGGDDVICIDID